MIKCNRNTILNRLLAYLQEYFEDT